MAFLSFRMSDGKIGLKYLQYVNEKPIACTYLVNGKKIIRINASEKISKDWHHDWYKYCHKDWYKMGIKCDSCLKIDIEHVYHRCFSKRLIQGGLLPVSVSSCVSYCHLCEDCFNASAFPPKLFADFDRSTSLGPGRWVLKQGAQGVGNNINGIITWENAGRGDFSQVWIRPGQ